MNDRLKTVRWLVWTYLWLLIFEGALRKWLLPQLSSAFLLIRDPVVILIYAAAMQARVFPRSRLVAATLVLAALCGLASAAGIGTPAVTLFGLRANFLHLPLIAVLPCVLRREDVSRMGMALLAVLPGMTVLAMLQFKAGPSSYWNVGAGGEVGAQLFAAEGKVRASGTFSFSTGFATYLALCAAYLLHDLLAGRAYPRWLVLAAVSSLALSLAVSGSRTAVLAVAFVCAMVLWLAIWRPREFGGAFRPIIVTLVVVAALSYLTPVFDEGIRVHRERFEGAGGMQKGILQRYANEFVSAAYAMTTAPVLGNGLGVGTNVGSTLLRGRRDFILGEGELERIIFESGPILGLAVIGLRFAILARIAQAAMRAYRAGNTLPLLLVAVDGVDLMTGKFGQPTALGFAVFTAGLTLAAASTQPEHPTHLIEPMPTPEPRLRGRSPYAERLHGRTEEERRG